MTTVSVRPVSLSAEALRRGAPVRPYPQLLRSSPSSPLHTSEPDPPSIRSFARTPSVEFRVSLPAWGLKRTLASTNPCESMIECVRRSARNVKRWQSGDMALRWTAAGMLEAERQFRRVIGYRELAKLAVAVERELARETEIIASPKPAPEVVACPA